MKSGFCWLVCLGLTISCTANNASPRSLAVTLTAPDRAWSVAIEQVRLVEGELWVLARLARQEGMAAQVLSPVSDQVQVMADQALPVRYFIMGKTWGWGESETYTFLAAPADLPAGFAAGKLLYERGDAASTPVSSFPEAAK